MPTFHLLWTVFLQHFCKCDWRIKSRIEQVFSDLSLSEEKSDSGLTVILLADFDLLQLPLEALSLLQSDCVTSVARDFSLQMLYHRINKFIVGDVEGKNYIKD